MIRKLFCFHLSSLFGKCKPIAINDWDNVIQIKYSLSDLEAKMIYVGMERLQKRYRGKYRVRLLFVYPGILQVIIGDENAVSRIGESDFRIEVC